MEGGSNEVTSDQKKGEEQPVQPTGAIKKLGSHLRVAFDPSPLTSSINFKISQVFGGSVTPKEKVYTPLKITNGNLFKIVE